MARKVGRQPRGAVGQHARQCPVCREGCGGLPDRARSALPVQEVPALTGSSDLNLRMQTVGSTHDRVIIKRGSAGTAIGGRSGATLSLPALPTEVVDTTGAGAMHSQPHSSLPSSRAATTRRAFAAGVGAAA